MFNFSRAPEYSLNSSMIKEVINLYGVKIKFLKTNKINHDATIFKDFSHLEGHDVFELNALPENSEAFDTANIALQDFGLLNFDNVSLFVHQDSFKGVCQYNEIVGNIVVLPSNKVMEIVNTEEQVPGINNLFTYDDAKSVYKLTCKPYDFKSMDELQNLEYTEDKDQEELEPLREYDALDEYFSEILKDTEERRQEAEVLPTVQTSDGKKPMVNKDEDDVWGQFF